MYDAARGADFSLETDISELIRHTRDHFNDEVLNEWHKSILSNLIVDVEKEARDISSSLDDVIYNLQKRRIKTRDAVQKLAAMSVGKEDYEAQVLINLANLIQKTSIPKSLVCHNHSRNRIVEQCI